MDNDRLWQQVLTELELSSSKATFQTWFKGKTALVKYSDGIIQVGCNSSITRDWIESRYYTQIKKIADKVTGVDNALVFTVTPMPQAEKKASQPQNSSLFDDKPEKEAPSPVEISAKSALSNLNPRYTFANFVVGNNNQLAHAVAQAISSSPAKAYNPFFIYGGVGVGKTHLMHAVGHDIIQKFGSKVLYCTSEAFTNEMIESIQEKKNSSFRNKYRKVDVLLIDDIQFIAGRETTQEEFFHTFNELHGKGKQIIMTSDRPPKDIAKLEARLRSRFEGGMIADIQNPDIDMRQAILLSKCRQQGLVLPPEVINYLAANVTSSIRDLEGSLIRVATQAKITNQMITLELAQKVIGAQEQNSFRPKQTNPKKLLDVVCTYFSVKPTDLKGSSRQADLVLPRQLAMYLLRVDMGFSLTKTAELLERKDHTTVMHAVEKIEKIVENDDRLRESLADIRTQLWTEKN
jgi:chromosomal replication initiator protein